MTTLVASGTSLVAKNAPSPDPSSCPAAEEDATTLQDELTRMEWASSSQEDPLPAIDFDAPTRSTSSSRFAPGVMVLTE
jgi:hypothetical protein